MSIFMGVDPGSHRLGLGFIEVRGSFTPKVLEYETFETAGMPEERLLQIARRVADRYKRWTPGKVGVEKVFFGRNRSHAMQTAEARGAILCGLAGAGMKSHQLVEFAPNTAKKLATGSGNADKYRVRMTLEAILHTTLEGHDDGWDALMLAYCAAFHKKLEMPEAG